MPHPLRPDSSFVSAQWKNRVPEPEGPQHGVDNPQTGYLRFLLDKYLQGKGYVTNTTQLRRLKHEFDAESARMEAQMDRLAKSCARMPRKYGTAGSVPTAAGAQQQGRAASPTRLSMRSVALRQAGSPGRQQRAAGAAGAAEHAAAGAGAYGAAGGAGGAGGEGAAAVHAWGDRVDLNPGLSFVPGTPEKRHAVLSRAQTIPEQEAAQTRQPQPLSDPLDLQRGTGPGGAAGPGWLSHRERLQAGIQELNGQLYGSIRAVR